MEISQYQEAGRELIKKLRLYTDPVAIKFIKDASVLPKDAVRPAQMGRQMAFCQAFFHARRNHQHLVVMAEDNFCTASNVGLGFSPVDNEFETFIESQLIQGWHKDQEAEIIRTTAIYTAIGLENIERVKEISAVYCAPLSETTVIPDAVIIYGMPSQITCIIQSLCWEFKYPPNSSFEGFGESCIKGGFIPYFTGKPQVIIPGAGDRRFGAVDDNEIGIGIPGHLVSYVLENLFKTGTAGNLSQTFSIPPTQDTPALTPEVLPGFAFLDKKVKEYKAKNK